MALFCASHLYLAWLSVTFAKIVNSAETVLSLVFIAELIWGGVARFVDRTGGAQEERRRGFARQDFEGWYGLFREGGEHQ